jgi:predicted PurR-regulated permease PerM
MKSLGFIKIYFVMILFKIQFLELQDFVLALFVGSVLNRFLKRLKRRIYHNYQSFLRSIFSVCFLFMLFFFKKERGVLLV